MVAARGGVVMSAQHTPGPWHTCRDAKCSCFTVMADDHPIAEVTHGAWGDEYPAVRLVGDSSFDLKAEAYIERIEYGSVDEAVARANWRLIAAAPDLLAALKYVMTAHAGTIYDACEMAHRAIKKAEAGEFAPPSKC